MHFFSKRSENGLSVYSTSKNKEVKHRVRHSPDGFECGYNGSGPSDLALSICTEVYGPDIADKIYKIFREQVVSKLPRDKDWDIFPEDFDKFETSKELLEIENAYDMVISYRNSGNNR